MVIDLYYVHTFIQQDPIPSGPGVPPGAYEDVYSRDGSGWDNVLRDVVPVQENIRVPGNDAQPATPPTDYIRPAGEQVDAFTVPTNPGAPGYAAGKEGMLCTVTSDGQGVVVRTYTSTDPSLDLTAQGVRANSSGKGSITATPTGGVAPLTLLIVDTGATAPGTDGQPTSFGNLDPGTYSVRVTDSAAVPQTKQVEAEVLAYVPPVLGCGDPEANNYVPGGTQPDTCRYTPRWVGVWARSGVLVPVVPTATPSPAYLTASLWAGFPDGHPLAEERPLEHVVEVRATVGPNGVAVFDLAPYLKPLLGTPTTGGVRRLDLNSPTAHAADLYVGWALYIGTEKLAHGFALNSALDEAVLEGFRFSGAPLSPFGAKLPYWPGFAYPYTMLSEDETGRLGQLATGTVNEFTPPGDIVPMRCQDYPLPVAWLTPEGSFAYWVFGGRPEVGDEVGEGTLYTEGGTGERRYSQRGAAYATFSAWSGLYGSRALADGLRTLLRAVQVWAKPDPEGPWQAVTLASGSFPAYRAGRTRYETTLTFTEALSAAVQGQ